VLWVNLDGCKVLDGPAAGEDCGNAFHRLANKNADGLESSARPLLTLSVRIRGTSSTVPPYDTKDKSLPKWARGGFGHLGQYPAEVHVDQLQILVSDAGGTSTKRSGR
jgi:hypothetical protein